MKKVYTKFFLVSLAMLLAIGLLNHCKTVALTAPDDAVLNVSVNPPVIQVGEQAVIKIIGYKSNGSPIPDGTVIFFTTDIGSIDPTAETTAGIAQAIFRSDDNRIGVARIGVISGNAVYSRFLTIFSQKGEQRANLGRAHPFTGIIRNLTFSAFCCISISELIVRA